MKPLKKSLSITLDQPVLERVQALAEKDDRSLSSYINLVLRAHRLVLSRLDRTGLLLEETAYAVSDPLNCFEKLSCFEKPRLWKIQSSMTAAFINLIILFPAYGIW